MFESWQHDTNFMTNTHEIKQLFIKAYFTTKRLRPVSFITKLGFQNGDTNIRERDDILTTVPAD